MSLSRSRASPSSAHLHRALTRPLVSSSCLSLTRVTLVSFSLALARSGFSTCSLLAQVCALNASAPLPSSGRVAQLASGGGRRGGFAPGHTHAMCESGNHHRRVSSSKTRWGCACAAALAPSPTSPPKGKEGRRASMMTHDDEVTTTRRRRTRRTRARRAQVFCRLAERCFACEKQTKMRTKCRAEDLRRGIGWLCRELGAFGARPHAVPSPAAARGSRLAARGSRLAARGSRLAARGSRLAARGSRLAARGSRLAASG